MWLLCGHHLRAFLFHRPGIFKVFFFLKFCFVFILFYFFNLLGVLRVSVPFCTRVRHACEQCGLYLFGFRFFLGANSLVFPLCQLIKAREAFSFLALSFQLSVSHMYNNAVHRFLKKSFRICDLELRCCRLSRVAARRTLWRNLPPSFFHWLQSRGRHGIIILTGVQQIFALWGGVP